MKTEKFYGGTVALHHGFTEISMKYNSWKIGVIRRDHTWFKFSQDTAKIIYLVKNKKVLESGKVYQIDIDGSRLTSDGLSFGKSFNVFKELKLAINLNIIRGHHVIFGNLKGEVRASSESDIEFQNLNIDYSHDEDRLFDREVIAPDGQGYSTDLAIYWSPQPQLNLGIEIINLTGFINWTDSPYTIAKVTSDNKTYDENGYVSVDPGFSGRMGNKDVKQTMPRVIQAFFSLKTDFGSSYLVEMYHTNVKTFVSVGLSHFQWLNWKILYTPETEAVTLGAYYKWINASILTDSINYDSARTFGLTMNLHYEF